MNIPEIFKVIHEKAYIVFFLILALSSLGLILSKFHPIYES